MSARYELRTSSWWTVIATNSITTNLMTHAKGPRTGSGLPMNRPCRAIIVSKPGTGTLALTKLDTGKETLTSLVAGQELPVQATKILPASAFSEIVVLW